MLDSIYKPIQISNFSGPDYLFAPLQMAADAIRTVIRPAYNTSIVDANSGYYYIRNINGSSYTFRWQTQIDAWYPSNGTFGTILHGSLSILTDCAARVH